MSKKVFTNEEVEILRNNPYTYAVMPHILSFTKEFQELFWKECHAGKIPRQILEKHGYPADALGKERIWGIAHTIKSQYYSEEGLHEGSLKKSSSGGSDCKTTEETVRQLQNEVQYLRQEIEFLKKFPRSELPGSRRTAYE
ncbi:hypothetical protein E5329_24175 [Petralouisia muris]|uniref:Uncharacterized protein n=1 Tax=Petralouisia muris TaxID=3032872 RepID=A0AC61RP44_9FIRM|nr:HTH domain-containing protein [Petralouisia muris]TGY90801.1 hypothetical protein E5329_24175 [Petralouisia muris]